MERKILKVIYFDEEAAIDYITISDGGKAISEIINTEQETDTSKFEGETSTGFKIPFLTWFNLQAKIGMSSNINNINDEVVKSTLTNTILTDYIKKDGILLVNKDDEASKNFIEKFKNTKTYGYGSADYDIISDDIHPDHTDITFKVNGHEYKVTTNLTSKFNVYNYFTMFSILCELGFDIELVIEKTKNLKAPKGRCETYKVKDGFAVVDYAHTPDAVLKVVTAYKELARARVITVVGCGGDRDPMKRPIMGEIASNYSDYVIFTNDNPRTEDPEKIMKDILAGVKKDNYEVCLDRREAIKRALDMICKDDIVLLLGKGHEDYQILGHTKVHLDDSEEILKYIEKSE